MRKDENQRSSQSEQKINVKQFLRKRWVVPAIYLIAAAGVLSSVFFLQGNDESTAPEDSVAVQDPTGDYGDNAIEVTTSSEVVKLPIEDENDFTVVGNYYDVNASEEEQQEALVYYDHSYYPNKGIDYAHVEGESFNVVASLSGTVLKAEKDSILGYVVEMKHDHGITTHYHSLESLDVEVGAMVKQGDILGQAGRNLYNEEAGVHVHFEVRQDEVPINPNDIFQQPIDSVKDAAGDKEDEEEKSEDQSDQADKDEDKDKKEESNAEQSANDDDKDEDKDKDKEQENADDETDEDLTP